MKPAEIRFSQQRLLQHRDPGLAPTITAAMANSQEHPTLTHKLRKPLVEKLRRERISSSLSWVQSSSNSSLEKADISEMTVYFLTHLQQQSQQQRRLLTHFNKMQTSSDEKLREADFSLLSSTVQTSITKDESN